MGIFGLLEIIWHMFSVQTLVLIFKTSAEL